MTSSWKSFGRGATAIVLLTVVTYLPALRGGFVFDDTTLITDNRMVHAEDGLYRFWFTTEAPDYYPLTWSLWWVEWRMWGTNPLGYHVVNVLLHAGNAVLVWITLRRLSVPGAWLAGLIFAVHPVNAATVAWISEQKNTLSMLFYLVAILLYLRFDEEGRWRWYGLSLGAFLLALLSKSAVVMMPVVLLGCVWWLHGRVRWQDFRRSVPFLLLSLALGLVAVWFQYHQVLMKGAGVRPLTFGARLVTAGWVPWFYLAKVLAPVNLMVIYPKWNINPSSLVAWLPGVILVSFFVLFWLRRGTWGRASLFGFGYFVVTLFPVLGFFDQALFVSSLVADHWQYYSMIGVIGLVVAGGEKLCARMNQRRFAIEIALSVMTLATLSMATWKRGRVYATDESLWQDNVTKNPSAWLAQFNLGVALKRAGRVEEAIKHYRQALQSNPTYAEAHVNLGVALQQEGNTPEAIKHYQQALKISPNLADVYYNLGLALQQTNDFKGAIAQYRQALRIDPESAVTHNNLGIVLQRESRMQEAMTHYRRAIEIDPGNADAHYNLGIALEREGMPSEALVQYERALKINTQNATLRRSLALVLQQLGQTQRAIDQWEAALRIQPDYAEAHYNLGVACVQLGREQEAVSHWLRALQIKPDYAEAHYNLGVACVQQGKVEEATGHWQEALRINPSYAEAHYNLGVALEEQGQIQNAVGHYREALRIKPDYQEAQDHLARLQGMK